MSWRRSGISRAARANLVRPGTEPDDSQYSYGMIATDTLLNGLPPQLTLRFFAVFARLEYAMKYADCLVSANPGDTAMASRKTLAAKLPASFFEEAKAVAPELVAEPPRTRPPLLTRSRCCMRSGSCVTTSFTATRPRPQTDRGISGLLSNVSRSSM